MSPREDDDGLGDWLAELAEEPADVSAAPGARTEPTSAAAHPTVPAPGLLDDAGPPRAGAAAGAARADVDDLDAPPGRSRRLWAMAALPWLLVASVAVLAWSDVDFGDASSGSGVDAGDEDPAGAEAPPEDGPAAGGPATAEGGEASAVTPGASVSVELAAAAEAAVRTVGAERLAELEDTAVHVEHARAIAATPLGRDGGKDQGRDGGKDQGRDGGKDQRERGGAAPRPSAPVVVTVAALVRRADGDRWTPPEAAWFAAVVDGAGRLRAPPWPVPAAGRGTEVAAPSAAEPIDLDEAGSVVGDSRDALARAGYEEAEVQALHRVDDGRALRVEAIARPPGARRRGPTVVWLDPDADAVLGHAADRGDDRQRATRGD